MRYSICVKIAVFFAKCYHSFAARLGGDTFFEAYVEEVAGAHISEHLVLLFEIIHPRFYLFKVLFGIESQNVGSVKGKKIKVYLTGRRLLNFCKAYLFPPLCMI